MPSTLKLVRMDDACAVAFCTRDGARITACEVAQNPDDFMSGLSGRKANMLAGAATTSYIICALSGGNTYIPVLPQGQQGESTNFAFKTTTANPVMGSHTPKEWRVAFASLRTTFHGVELNSSTDTVRALLGGALLSASARVCPSASTVVQTALFAQMLPGLSSTTTTVAYSQSYLRYAMDEVHFCYVWDAGKRVSYAGSLTFAARLPSEMTTLSPPHDGFRAGAPVSLSFTSNTTELRAQSDKLFFYRLDAVSNVGVSCYCGLGCLGWAQVTYKGVPLVPGASASTVTWTQPQGFDNYDYDAVYVVCYNATKAGSATYMGQLSVGMAQPTYYTAQNAGGTNRVGYPITLTVTQLCVGVGCRRLSLNDEIQLIPATETCLKLGSDTELGGNVEPVGKATCTGTDYIQRVVVNRAGDYRMCYRLANESFYEELISDLLHPPTPLTVSAADPASFTTTPASPSAGQFTSVHLTCSNERCKVCTTLRLVPGEMASCWENVSNTFSSNACQTTTVVGFFNQYLPKGTFTACYGAVMVNSRRVPGALTVAAANPSSFTASSTNIFVNQVSEVTLTLVGTGLTSKDQIFLLTNKGYTCHDLGTNVLQSNGTLRAWFAPSISPSPIIVNTAGTSATWVVSDREHRFGAGLLSDPSLCDNPGVSCSMRLCYMRSGTSWAPVPIQSEPFLSLFPPNPVNASFDRYPLAVGMYSAVTVFGQGLTAADTVTVRRDTCGGSAVTVAVGTATVSPDGMQWTGVVRFTAAGAINYVVCYTFGTVSTEIGLVQAHGHGIIVVLGELYYLYTAANFTADHTLSTYEALMVSGSFAQNPVDHLDSAAVISVTTECNYIPYYEAANAHPEFVVLLNLQRLSSTDFGARFTLPADTYALCLQVQLGLFRVTQSTGMVPFTATLANPSTYASTPNIPFPNQPFTLTFPLLDGKVGDTDAVTIIDGDLYDCGYRNVTVVAEFPVLPDLSPGAHAGIVTGGTLPVEMLGKFLTVCYRRSGGTFATVPRGTLVDRNFRLTPQVPSAWTHSPVQPQASRTLRITFVGNESEPDFLQIIDRAALLLVTAEGHEPTCDETPMLRSGDLEKTGKDTTWTIPANQTQNGTYVVCYMSVRNGMSVRVTHPPLLTIFSLQSPKGIFKNTGGPVNVFSGERFYLMFDTDVPLDPVLSFDSNASARDAVLFSTKPDCSSPLTAAEVATIPASFHYKPVVVKNSSGLVVPYLHLILATTKATELVVCMQRTGRHAGEAFYKYEMIGDLESPAMVRVSEAPITDYVTVPRHPRAWVPSIAVAPTYSSRYTVKNVFQLFFTNGSAAVAAAGSVVNECYRPTAEEASGTPAEGVVLLDTTLQVDLAMNVTLLPFPRAGPFQLCVQISGSTQHAAAVHTAALEVLNSSPTAYIVPEVIGVGADFQMAFRALDGIFAATVTGNVAQVFVAPPDVVSGKAMPDCATGVAPSGGSRTRFDTFDAANNTYATVQPRIQVKGYFYVCFRVYDQTAFFVVPNAVGGVTFSVGLTGPQSYMVAPSPAYMGEVLNITILGNVLRHSDHVKVVNVSGETPGTNHSSRCTAEAANADAEEKNGPQGSLVSTVSPTQAQYMPRVNSTGVFIICYQSVSLANVWVWVSQLNDFSVGPPHPNAYAVQPLSLYAAEVGRLHISDSPSSALLTDKDEVKLVQRGSGIVGFDCSAAAVTSPDIGLLARVTAASNNTDAMYQLCALATTQVTVCYRLKRGAWAEVPRRVNPPSYLFEPVMFVASPFGGPTATPSAPRPYEPFVLTFTSSVTEVVVSYVGFAHAPQKLCEANPPYVKPMYYVKNTTVANSFTVALAAAGEYQLYLGPHAAEGDPRIAHGQTFTVAPCDPCSFGPSYAFIENRVALKFSSNGGGGSLSLRDTVRLVPLSQGADGNPCTAPKGAFASITLEANATVSTSDVTVFNLFTGNTSSSLGDYYLCYRKGANESNYALVTDAANELLTFSIYPALPTQASTCESHPAFLETVTFNFSFAAATYPKLAFSNKDEFLLLPPNVDCGDAASATAPGVIHPVLHSLVRKDLAMWLSQLPGGYRTTRYTICFRLVADAVARVVAPRAIDVAPQNPARVETEPWFIQPKTAPFTMRIYGMQLSQHDDVYVVDASTRCDERCGETLTPPKLPSAVYTKKFRNTTLMELQFTRALNENVTMAVCYRRARQLLVRLAVFFVGNTNPMEYETDFVPRLGTRPTLTFHGAGLTSHDRVFILAEGMYCDESYAVAVGTFVDTAAEGTRSRFYIPLAAAAVRVGQYSVCYFVKGSAGYALMPVALKVKAGGASSYVTSNTPMRARATVVTFDYTGDIGDTAMIACAGCSCWDGKAATLPYGNPEGTATVSQSKIQLRVGIDDTAAYAVCYRVSDSGYAQVGAQPIRPVENTPAAFTIEPKSTFQGQRLRVTVTGFEHPTLNSTLDGGKKKEEKVQQASRDPSPYRQTPKPNDAAMLVTVDRLCWDTATMNSTGVLAGPSDVAGVTPTESFWQGHVPSLGPAALPLSDFPKSFTLCYRENGQAEFVVVPFPSVPSVMQPADPSNFDTVPPSVFSGMLRIGMTFAGAADGDTASIVGYAGASLTTNHACDDNTSMVLAQPGPVLPSYTFSLPPHLTATSTVVCYVRAGATVAEVPKLLQLTAPNPGGYVMNTPARTEQQRQYLLLTLTGTELDPTTDAVVFTNASCASSSTWPPVSASSVRRVSALDATPHTAQGTSLTLAAQFVETTQTKLFVCYRRGKVWSEVGMPFSLASPVPRSLALQPPVGLARVGQHIQIKLHDADTRRLVAAAVISAVDSSPESWCQNFTVAKVQEPLLKIVNESLLDVAVWRTAGPARVCVRYGTAPWSDVALTPTGAVREVVVGGPNPSSMRPFPHPPRVGQQVTLTFQLVEAPSAKDLVRIAELQADVACEQLKPAPGFPNDMPVVPDVEAKTASITLVDKEDKFKYRSFSQAGRFQVCYYSAAAHAWSLVGGSTDTSVIEVFPMVPSSWSPVTDLPLVFAEPFVLHFDDGSGSLDASSDAVWVAPSTQSCGVTPDNCPRCIVFELDAEASTIERVVTKPAVSLTLGKFNLCYRLRGATAALLSPLLEIVEGEIRCLKQETVRVGQQQNVTFEKKQGISVEHDDWRVSFFGTSATSCSSGYDPDFVEGRAHHLSSTDTTVTYGVEWPVSMVGTRYLICYTHNGVARPVCTCEQVSEKSGECYVSTLRASPLWFAPSPDPTYVGQTVRLQLKLDPAMEQHPVTDVKLVSYKNSLTVCTDSVAFPVHGRMIVESHTLYVFEFKYTHTQKPGTFIVCALSPELSKDYYSRVGTVNPARSSNTFRVRPYMMLTTFPSDPNLIRAMQTIRMTFTHSSSEADDVVGVGDRVTFVASPDDCVASIIDNTSTATVMNLFMADDTSFATVPAPVLKPSNVTRSSLVDVTFDPLHGLGKRVVCYKLAHGTWAPVMNGIDVLAAAVKECVTSLPGLIPGPDSDAGARALQYLRTTIVGTKETSTLRGRNDAVRMVPQSSLCIADDAAVFLTGVSIIDAEKTAVIAFAPTAGVFKVCYRIGGADSTTSNWSPVCTRLKFTEPTPTGLFTGCLRLGQSLTVTVSQRSGFEFALTDTFRFVTGEDQCIYANGTQTVSSDIMVGDAAQKIAGTPVTKAGPTFVLPAALLGAGSTTFRLCYKDTQGNQFAVPLDATDRARSKFTVAPRLIASVRTQDSKTAGQRVVVTFTAAEASGSGGLKPFDRLPPSPFSPGPEYDGSFDAATALHLSASVAYREGRCFAVAPTTYGVYGNSTQVLGSFDPVQGGTHLACYRSAGCSVEDVGPPFPVGGYNPASFDVDPLKPRRGQMLRAMFTRSQEEGAHRLTPGEDRAAVQMDLPSCWGLPADAGKIVNGTTDKTVIGGVFFAAQPPHVSSISQLRLCYELQHGSWSNLPGGGTVLLQPANPISFAVRNAPARTMQLNYIEFAGKSLGARDRVKIITKSSFCQDASVPPSEIVSHAFGTTDPIPGTADGWTVTNATVTSTILNISSTGTGTYSVCYRLATDTVWTLVYGDLVISTSDPAGVVQTPVSTLEGELFTLNFTAAEASSTLSENDRVALYTGVLSCLAPGKSPVVIITAPSRKDLLPRNLFFQIAAETRGDHTLCYWKANGHIIIWGFDKVVIRPNPLNYTTVPPATALRTSQLISSVFWGFGLIADPSAGKTDQVKLIPSTQSQTDGACQTVATAAGVEYYPLVANGTLSVQTFRSSPGAEGSYWVCYKLDGGQFHVMTGAALVLGVADPYAATAAKHGDVILDGEMNTWTIKSRQPPAAEDALAFYSAKQCNDFPYYVTPAPSTAEFPYGVTVVRDGVARLRAGSATEGGVTLALCYYDVGVTTMLSESAARVVRGVPPSLSAPVSATALQVFQFNLTVSPTPLDYVVLVANPDACVGLTAPVSPSSVFIDVLDAGGHVVVTTAVERAGTFYICYSHRVDRCDEDAKEECARIVGTVEAAAANPSNWTMTPATVFTSDEVEIELLRPAGAAARALEKLWLTPTHIDAATTMKQVAAACINTMTGGDRIVLQPNEHRSSVWTARLDVEAAYALCYLSKDAVLPTIFPPLSHAGPVVHLTQVTSVTFVATPVVGINATVILQGRGLSQGDQLLAVGLPVERNTPADICTNPSYTPRVTAVASEAGYGFNALVYQLLFETASAYTLCFHAMASTEPTVPITANNFNVSPAVLSYTMESVALTNAPLELEFRGHGLQASDQAALVYLLPGTKVESASCARGKYTAVSSASEDGTTSHYITVPTQPGTYAVCYRKPGFTSILLPEPVNVSVQTATAAVFTVRPSCSALEVCSPQPVVGLTDAAGEPTSDLGATVVMHLWLADGKAADELLTGGTVYMQKNYSEFYFFVIEVSTAGEYTMEAEFTLRGGVRLRASLPNLVVEKAEEKNRLAAVTCEPVGIIERPLLSSGQNDPSANITCVITAKSPLAPTAYTVQLNAGRSTEVVLDPHSSSGLPWYNFTVFPPYDMPLIQFVSITTKAAPPLQSWPVMHSPVIVRIGSEPEEGSILSCASDSSDLPSTTMVRFNSKVTCYAQGRRRIQGVEVNIVALPMYMKISREYNDDRTTDKAVNIGAYPENLDGNYVFHVDVAEVARTLAILGFVPSAQGSGVFVPMQGSPSRFTVIGEPQSGESTLTCVSVATGSKAWFAPVESFQCTLSLRGGGMTVNGVPQDFLVSMPQGGSTQPISKETWGPTLVIHGAVPPIAQNATPPAASQLFGVEVTFLPQLRSIAAASGTVVYASSIEAKQGSGGYIVLMLMGSGLSPDNKYGVRATLECDKGVDRVASVSGSDAANMHLQLSVTKPGGPFYLCFAPSDQQARWQLLSNVVLNYHAGGVVDMWTTLLIVGVILLFILLLLLLLVVWRVCMLKRREAPQGTPKAVYMPPRANYRFLRRDTTNAPVEQQLHSPETAPPSSWQVSALQRDDAAAAQVQWNNPQQHSNIDGRDDYSAASAEDRNEETLGRYVGTKEPQTFERNRKRRSKPQPVVETDSSDDEHRFSRFIPSVPPPQPPRGEEPPPLIGAVTETTETHARAAEETPRSGPYQHLHQPRQEPSPVEAPSPATATTTAIEEDAGGAQQWVGPFLVRGHTSRPMVSPTPAPNGSSRNGGPPNGK
ncbi:hemagluttinin family protein [Trypanosoma rangeli]|uniref:Hemagluttinin family protein n=1 Tax=Trypanosoma rangeli TaxID=5698 RepID=A0A3R7LRS1_TRYRA|nr:hemagluttinin family protein [Trypanosoma rangeli]RNF02103.1 hemagluttinin family protein [Trypanosoma rangeli]|eukprot:RNF02103.1 hemagluttinin family protein [Trypanosoma rangeli]